MILDTKYVDVKLEGGKLVAEFDAKKVALEYIKPALVNLKAKIPGTIDDAIIDKILEEIEAV